MTKKQIEQTCAVNLKGIKWEVVNENTVCIPGFAAFNARIKERIKAFLHANNVGIVESTKPTVQTKPEVKPEAKVDKAEVVVPVPAPKPEPEPEIESETKPEPPTEEVVPEIETKRGKWSKKNRD